MLCYVQDSAFVLVETQDACELIPPPCLGLWNAALPLSILMAMF